MSKAPAFKIIILNLIRLIFPVLGSLSTNNRLKDRFSSSNSRQIAGQVLSGLNFTQKCRKGKVERKEDL